MVPASGNIDLVIRSENCVPVRDQKLRAMQDCCNTDFFKNGTAGNITQAHTEQLRRAANPDDCHTGIRMTEPDLFKHCIVIQDLKDFSDR